MEMYEEIIGLIRSGADSSQLREQLNQYHPRDLAECFKKVEESDRIKLYAAFSDEEMADILAFLDPEDVPDLTENVEEGKLASIINEMEPDDAADVISKLDDSKAENIYNLMEPEVREDLQELAEYADDTAGAIMNSNFIKIETGKDIKDLMKVLVQEAPDVETINTSFVVDGQGKLLGTLDLKKIIVTKSPCLVESIMNPNFQAAEVNQNIEEVTRIVKNYDVYDLPVLENGILKGIITMDDAMTSVIDEAEEDFAKLGGLSSAEEIDESTKESVKKRFPWLAFLLVMDILVSLVVSAYDYLFEVDSMTVFVFFQPIILGLAGNFGTQSLAFTIRKITDDQFAQKSSIRNHLFKETMLGLATGLILGIAAFAFTALFLLINKEPQSTIPEVSLVVGLSVFASLTISSLFGSLMPIVLFKMKVDPAVASGPVITTIIDVLSVVIYLTLATLLVYNQLM
ncbi:MAG TPA: magnesium transporter [Acholeplasmatales bacterium]|nr:magnesium transporter [Acholeplasmatales bacterium]